MRNRLRLAVGDAAVIDEELEAEGAVHRFTARGPADPPDGAATRLVSVLPPPPAGPPGGAVLDRLAAIRVIGSPALAAPLATGTFDDGTWVVESLPVGPTVAERLAGGGPMPVQRVIRLLRDTARALSALHRHGLTHGALAAGVLEETPEGFVLHGLARRLDATVSDDLHALGTVARAALDTASGDRSPGTRRRTVPVELDRLVAALVDPDPAVRPATAAAVLRALDRFPVGESTPLGALIDGAGRGARLPDERRAALLLGALGVLLILGWLFLRGN